MSSLLLFKELNLRKLYVDWRNLHLRELPEFANMSLREQQIIIDRTVIKICIQMGIGVSTSPSRLHLSRYFRDCRDNGESGNHPSRYTDAELDATYDSRVGD